MFHNSGNYVYFLKKYDEYLSPVLDTYAYCLLGNHFHLLVRIKPISDLTTFKKFDHSKLLNLTAHDIVSHQFRKFFQSYSMAFNKQSNRIGTLFQTPFKRAVVNNEQHFNNLVYYIHTNPKRHDLVDDFKDWEWSSYERILIEKPTKLKKNEVLNWFGNKNEFVKFHGQNQKLESNDKMFIEDDD
ncbi:MAG: hypothetical protein SFY32_10300 [Bacteroidota bacterium]|nr:hypothetical protein [Bacteroidota bacterium]